MGSGCGAFGRVVASNTRGPGFESSHWQLLLNIYLLLTVCRKDENKEKEAGNGPFFLKKSTVPKRLFKNTENRDLACPRYHRQKFSSNCLAIYGTGPKRMSLTGIHQRGRASPIPPAAWLA